MNEPSPRAPRRMLQPTKDQIRAQLAQVEAERDRLLARLSNRWWKRLWKFIS